MKKGDYVAIKKAFTPNSTYPYKFYSVGIVVALISTPPTTEILVYLYDPSDGSIFIDEFKQQPIFSFQPTDLITPLNLLI